MFRNASVTAPPSRPPAPGRVSIADCYAFRMAQFVTRLDEPTADAIDRLVERGVFGSRSDAVRQGLEVVIDRHRRDEVAQRIIDGYAREPQGDEEVGWADEATVRMVADEPW